MEGFDIISITGALLLAGLLIETVLRIAGSFSSEAREGFRRVYIAGGGWLVGVCVWLGWKTVADFGASAFRAGGIIVVSLVLTVLLSYKQVK